MKLKIVGYFIFVIVCLCFSFLKHFPSAECAAFIEKKVTAICGECDPHVENITPVPIAGLASRSIRFSFPERQNITLSEPEIKIRLSSLFTDTVRLAFSSKVFTGSVSGNIHIHKNDTHQLFLNSAFKDLQVKRLTFGNTNSGYSLTGTISGKMSTSLIRSRPESLEGSVKIHGGRLELPDSFYYINKVPFTSLELNFKMIGQNRLKLQKCILKGSQIDADISGTILIEPSFFQYSPQLDVGLKFHPEFFMKSGNSKVAHFVRSNIGNNKVLNLLVKGTLSDPLVSLKRSER